MKTGTLVIGALIFALAAAAVLVWTNVIDFNATGIKLGQPTTTEQTKEADWAQTMTQLAAPDGMVFSFGNTDLAAWSVTDAHRIERFSFGGNSQTLARLSSTLPLDPENRLSGLQLKLPLAWAQKANGKKIEIGVVARQPQTNAAKDISLLYATLQAGNSGWHTLNLSSGFEVLKFTFDVPAVEAGYTAQPIIMVRSDSAGADKAVELVGIYIKPLSN